MQLSEANSTAPASPVAATNNQPSTQSSPQQGGNVPVSSITPARDQSGKFSKGTVNPSNSPITPPDDDPEFDFGDRKMKRSQVLSEMGRARQASKMLSDAQERALRAEQLEKADHERKSQLKQGSARKAIIAQLREAGLSDNDIREELSSAIYTEWIEPEQLSPEARRIRELEAQAAEREEKDKSRAEKQRLEDEERETQAEADALWGEITAAMEAGKIPNTKSAMRRVAAELNKFESRQQKIPLDEAIRRVKEQVGAETGEFAASATVDDLRELWGEAPWKAHVKKVLDWALAQSRGTAAIAAPRPQPRPLMQQEGQRKRMTPQEFDHFMRKVK